MALLAIVNIQLKARACLAPGPRPKVAGGTQRGRGAAAVRGRRWLPMARPLAWQVMKLTPPALDAPLWAEPQVAEARTALSAIAAARSAAAQENAVLAARLAAAQRELHAISVREREAAAAAREHAMLQNLLKIRAEDARADAAAVRQQLARTRAGPFPRPC